MRIAIFSGNEKWILRGLAVDLETALKNLGISVKRYEVDLANPGIAPPEADWYFFVQQGQLKSILQAWNFREDLVKKSICIFTHFDYKNCNFELLNSIHLVSHMSSHQMAISIGNGLSKSNSALLPLGVDPQRHYPIKQEIIRKKLIDAYPNIHDTTKRSYNGFCTRFWKKNTYTKRKNYESLFELINMLLAQGEKVLVIGDGWEKVKIKSNKNLVVINPPYKDYILFYNLMKVFISVTSYDGGPIPLLESMACGVPPVITNSGFAPDIIEDEKYGLKFQPFSQSETVMKLVKKSHRTNYSRKLLRDKAKEFSFAAYANKLVSLLEKSAY